MRLLACLAGLIAVPTLAHADVYKQDGCQVTVPSGWVASRSRTAQPDKKVWASIMQASSATEALTIEKSFGATPVSDNGHVVLMVSSASYGGMTNRQYHAITRTTPSCIADVTAPAGPDEALARQIAGTVGLAK